MHVKMIQCQAGTDFVRNPGDVVEVSDAEAIRMIEAGIALPVRDNVPETTAAPHGSTEATQARREKA